MKKSSPYHSHYNWGCHHRYQENNSKKSSSFKGFESRIIQHELDHLNGILFVDHLSRLKRDVIIRKMRKYKKEKELI